MAAPSASSTSEWSHQISQGNHGPYVTITACLMLTGMVLFLVIRLAIRWPWSKLIGLDDILTFIACVIGVSETVTVFEAVHFGLGQHADKLDSAAVVSMEKAIYAGDILFVVVLALSKLAVALLVLRLTSSDIHILTAKAIAGVIVVWGVASVLAIALRPDVLQPWDMQAGNNNDVVSHTTCQLPSRKQKQK